MGKYDVFAAYYDRLMENADYASRSAVYHDLLQREGVNDGILLDLACGTGSMSLPMADFGYDVIGVDASEAMLSVAQQKAFAAGKNILFLCQKMQDLDLYGTVRGTICALDSLNHLTQKPDLERTFERVSLFTEPGGVFVFDVNTVYKHRSVLADQTFVFDTDAFYCVWQNTLCGRGHDTIEIALDFFEKEGGVYYRSTEVFRERAYSPDYLTSVLERFDFQVIGIYAQDTMQSPCETTERLIFAAKKRGH